MQPFYRRRSAVWLLLEMAGSAMNFIEIHFICQIFALLRFVLFDFSFYRLWPLFLILARWLLQSFNQCILRRHDISTPPLYFISCFQRNIHSIKGY